MKFPWVRAVASPHSSTAAVDQGTSPTTFISTIMSAYPREDMHKNTAGGFSIFLTKKSPRGIKSKESNDPI